MGFNQLDSNSEKILKLFLKNNLLNMSQISVLLNKDIDSFAGFIKILINNNYIRNADIGKRDDKLVYSDGKYRITTNGKIYFDLKRIDWYNFMKRSFLVPIAVSIVTTLLTIWITTSLL